MCLFQIQIWLSELVFNITAHFLPDEVNRMLPSLVIQDQETAPRPKIAAHVTGSLPPETDKDLRGRLLVQNYHLKLI